LLASRWRPSHGSKVWVRPLGGRGGPETAAHGRCGRWRDEESHSECGQRSNMRPAWLSVNKRVDHQRQRRRHHHHHHPRAFAKCGRVTDCYLPTDRETGDARGFAFVTFEVMSEAEEAIAKMDGAELDGRMLKARATRRAAVQAPTS